MTDVAGAVPAPSWRDHRDAPVDVPPPPGPADPPFYAPIGDFQGELYRRNAFALATDAEAGALVQRLQLGVGSRVLDVGCGDGRHLRALASRGIAGVGVDISAGLVAAARAASEELAAELTFVVGDARDLAAVPAVRDGGFDAALALCQGGFGTSPASDPTILAGMARAVRPGGLVAVTAFSAIFAARHLAPGDAFDPVHLVHHQTSEVRGPDDAVRAFDLWTAAYTVRDLVRLVADVGLELVSVDGAEPGRYDATGTRLEDPELLVVARRPV
ncbi:MAG: class I SAM-dependent methyltransferase [Actinobacteria bacterium]|nr:class I SAM-dependent methyltransferase [Actinomycetota bacterium]